MVKRDAGDGRAPNRSSSAYKGTDGYWHGRVSMGVDDLGKPDRRHVMGASRAEVARKVSAPAEMRLLLVVGFLGGFTTFSSFSLDTLALAERGAFLSAFAYVGASVVLSLSAAFGGLALGRSLF